MKALLAGGGTAGHTSPLLATADALRRLDPSVEVTCLGTPRGLENQVVPAAGYPLELIPPVPMPRQLSSDCCGCPATCAARSTRPHEVLDRVRPDVVVGYGGYVSMPAYLAARGARLPMVVHEGNAMPGPRQQGRCSGRRPGRGRASRTPRCRKAEYIGLPIRRMISTMDRWALRAEARAFFGLDPDRPTMVVTGGSQGARTINESVSGADPALGRGGIQVLHVVGPKDEMASPGARRTAYVLELRRPHGPRAGRRGPDDLPLRRQLASPRRAPSGCRPSSYRCRSATASRPSTPAPSSTPAAPCSSPTPT